VSKGSDTVQLGR